MRRILQLKTRTRKKSDEDTGSADGSSESGSAAKTKRRRTGKQPAKGRVRAKSRARKTGSSAAKSTAVASGSAAASSSAAQLPDKKETTKKKPAKKCKLTAWSVEPPYGTLCPLTFKGCKVYHSVARLTWRVLPNPGESLYDKQFHYLPSNKKQIWKAVVSYCKSSPQVPRDSMNYAKQK